MRLATVEQIRNIAEDVYKSIGSGFSEDVYDKAMQVGLRLAHIHYEAQKVIEILYLDHCVGEAYPDLVVGPTDDRIVVELKAVSAEIGEPEEQQLRNYMTVLGIKRGILINFPQPGRSKGKRAKMQPDIREIKL